MRNVLLMAVIFLFAGCKTVNLADPKTKPIVIKEPHTAKGLHTLGKWELPAGTYEPDFESAEGIYFRAPSKIISHALGMSLVQRGGLFLPFPSAKDQHQGVWIDQQEGSGGLLGLGATSNKRVFRISEAIPFVVQQ